jgi:hypothetical protein
VDIIEIDIIETGWDGMDWIDLAQDRDRWRALVNTVMNLWVSLNAGKFLSKNGNRPLTAPSFLVTYLAYDYILNIEKYVVLKRRKTSTRLHNVTFQTIVLLC